MSVFSYERYIKLRFAMVFSKSKNKLKEMRVRHLNLIQEMNTLFDEPPMSVLHIGCYRQNGFVYYQEDELSGISHTMRLIQDFEILQMSFSMRIFLLQQSAISRWFAACLSGKLFSVFSKLSAISGYESFLILNFEFQLGTSKCAPLT